MKSPCVPPELPLKELDLTRIQPIIGEANINLGRYDGMLETLSNPELLVTPLSMNEAVLSSRIEGTQATLDEVYEFNAGIKKTDHKRNEIDEIINYRSAIMVAEVQLINQPLNLFLIRQMHKELMKGVRGQYKKPGEFRTEQNYIAKRNESIEEARFIPPHPMLLQSSLENWENYLSKDEDALILTAIAHAQLEILHPFMDGNGRIGRMLIPLLLFKKNAISKPYFYLSEYLEKERQIYYDKLLNITEKNEWEEWIVFFAEAVIKQSKINIDKIRSINMLYEDTLELVKEATRSIQTIEMTKVLFMHPIVNSTNFALLANIKSKITANKYLKLLEEREIIRCVEKGSGRKPNIYSFDRLLALL